MLEALEITPLLGINGFNLPKILLNFILAISANKNATFVDKKVDPHAHESITDKIKRKGKEIFPTIPQSLQSFYF